MKCEQYKIQTNGAWRLPDGIASARTYTGRLLRNIEICIEDILTYGIIHSNNALNGYSVLQIRTKFVSESFSFTVSLIKKGNLR